MPDPLSDIIGLLRPQAPQSKLVAAAGPWRVRRTGLDEVFYGLVLQGEARLEVSGKPPLELGQGDFVLVPAAHSFVVSSSNPVPPPRFESRISVKPGGIVRLGPADAETSAELLIGHCSFGSPDAELLVSLLPDIVCVRGAARLADLARLVRDEARADRAARDVVLEHLLQVLFIEALRASPDTRDTPGLLGGLADPRLSAALRAIHAAPERRWNVATLASAAGLSRSAFFSRFNRMIGTAPMAYVQAWRMTLARHMLRAGLHSVGEIAARTGYGSASAFSLAFSRSVGLPPARYARMQLDGATISRANA